MTLIHQGFFKDLDITVRKRSLQHFNEYPTHLTNTTRIGDTLNAYGINFHPTDQCYKFVTKNGSFRTPSKSKNYPLVVAGKMASTANQQFFSPYTSIPVTNLTAFNKSPTLPGSLINKSIPQSYYITSKKPKWIYIT